MFSLQDFIRKDKGLEQYGLITLGDKEIKQLQAVLLAMYKDVMRFCGKHGIRVALAGGSALGAVRHNGFIPWDDDIDLMMPREDCKKFIELFELEMGEKYGLASPAKTSKYSFHNIQVINMSTVEKGILDQSRYKYPGVCIDINAIDYVPRNRFAYYLKGILCNGLFFLLNSKMMWKCRTKCSDRLFSASLFSKVFYYSRLALGIILTPFSYKALCCYYDKFISSSGKTDMTSIPPGRDHYFKETRPIKVMMPFVESKFEGETAYLPNDVERYLKCMYGDNYMEIPPEGKREPHALTCLKFDNDEII